MADLSPDLTTVCWKPASEDPDGEHALTNYELNRPLLKAWEQMMHTARTQHDFALSDRIRRFVTEDMGLVVRSNERCTSILPL